MLQRSWLPVLADVSVFYWESNYKTDKQKNLEIVIKAIYLTNLNSFFSPFASELIWTIKIVAKHHNQLVTKYNDSLTCVTCTIL